MSVEYEIRLVVSADKLGEAISAIQPYAMEALKIAVVQDLPAPQMRTVHPRNRVNPDGARPIEETGTGRLIMSLLRTGPITYNEAKDELVTHGYSPNGASAVLSKMRQAGLIRVRVEHNQKVYELAA